MRKLSVSEVTIFPENFKSLNSLSNKQTTTPNSTKPNHGSKCLNKDDDKFARI